MCIYINSIDRKVWKVIQDGPMEITVTNADGIVIPKPEAHWNEEDEKKYNYDWKVRNIIIAALGVNEYHRVSHSTSAKPM
jgi:hypothetical protein